MGYGSRPYGLEPYGAGGGVADTFVIADLTGAYAILGSGTSVTSDLAGSYKILGGVTSDLAGSYAILADVTFQSEILKDNTGAVLASKSLNFVRLYDDTSGALVVSKTGLSTDSNGRFSFTDAALTVAGTMYRVDFETAEGHRRMPRKATT